MPSRIESVETPDGSFDMAVWLPDNGTGPGLLLIQEIFGVSAYIQAVADDRAGRRAAVLALGGTTPLQPPAAEQAPR